MNQMVYMRSEGVGVIVWNWNWEKENSESMLKADQQSTWLNVGKGRFGISLKE